MEEKSGVRELGVAAIVFLVGTAFVLWLVREQVFLLVLGNPILSGPGVQVGAVLLFAFLVTLLTLVLLVLYVQFGMEAQIRHAVRVRVEERAAEMSIFTRRWQLMYDNSPVPYFMMDDAGTIHNPNKATLRFFGATESVIANTKLYDLLTQVDSVNGEKGSNVSLLAEKVNRGIQIGDQEVALNTHGNTQRIALLSVFSLADDSLIEFRHLVALQDVTKDREAEAVKSDFLLLASHQLRTPTTTIKWYADYLLGSDAVTLDTTVREYLGEIYTANERMTDLVRTLLTVSRIEMGTLEPEYTRVAFGPVIDDILDELAPDIAKKHTQVHKNIVHEGFVYTDQVMMRIAIHNLLTNAIKYTPHNGSVEIHVRYTPENCEIVVKDNGYGIPAHEQERIFTKLFRASNAKKISTNGTGLGLYLTKSFVDKLGGTVTFESLEGKGTIFTITVPHIAPGA